MRRGWLVAFVAVSLAACQRPADSAGAAPAGVVTTPASAASAPAASASAAPASAAPVAPAPPATAYDQRVVNFGGYGSARFNEDAAAVRRAVGQPLDAAPPPDEPGGCHYLLSKPRGQDGFGLAFMIEGGKFVRYDVDSPTLVAPGGLTVGMQAQDVQSAFGAQVEVQPHKYVEGGKVLVVRPADGGEARLVFETDAAGTITSWRIGLEPQVHYVEGCS